MDSTLAEIPRRKSILESPWYWVYAFCTAALVALVLIGPKFAERQAQIERQSQGRERAARQRAGQAPSTPMSTAEDTSITLRPIALLLAGVLAVAWTILWWRHFRTPVASGQIPKLPELSETHAKALRVESPSRGETQAESRLLAETQAESACHGEHV